MSDGTRWELVRDLFERALDEQPADVGAWLDGAGVDDWRLREEVVSLMRHHAGAGEFLAGAAGDRLPLFLATDRVLAPDQVLGHYTIVRELGHGGMGRVYLARDGRLGRMVALKALSPRLTADPAHRERFEREARAAARLTHPGICTIHALEEFDGELYIAAEFVDGDTLRAEIRGGRPAPPDVVRTARELAAALAHAHEHGITHRDLKPENVMRARDGRLKILDFGLARIEAPGVDAHVTQPGAIMGTPDYMAPEQLDGRRADARSDVFSLGLLLYEWASGAHPFHAATALARVGRIVEGTADPLDSRRPDLPPAFSTLVERCLRKSPADRFASAADIVRALDGVDVRRGRLTTWWRAHQLVVVAMYFVACWIAWLIKEWQPGVTTALFFVVGTAAAVAGIFRGHLLFTERVNARGFAAEHRRATLALRVCDLVVATALAAGGVLLAASRPLAGVLAIGLGVGIGLAQLIVEPATTSASFDQ